MSFPLLLAGLSVFTVQSALGQSVPSKEYIRLNGQVIAIGNAPAGSLSILPSFLTFGTQTVNTPSNSHPITVTKSTNSTVTFNSLPSLSGPNQGRFQHERHQLLYGGASLNAIVNGIFIN